MKNTVVEKANAFKGINDIALKGEIVIYGSTYMANFPFYELANKSIMEMAIYNRSIEGMTIDEAYDLLDICVIGIAPSKIFLHLGENEETLKDPSEKYEKIVKTLRRKLPDSLVYIIGTNQSELNDRLKSFCDAKTVTFVDLSGVSGSAAARYKAQFKKLSPLFRNKAIDLCEAFAIANV